MGVGELWVGATSNLFYMENVSRVLVRQKEFVESDTVNGQYIPFMMILDKGYRIILIAKQHGNQRCLQPVFAESEKAFLSEQVFYSASTAVDRSGKKGECIWQSYLAQ